VLGPVTIGDHAVVAGGSLVREDVAPYTVVAGRPAKVVKTIARPDAAEATPQEAQAESP
jgi:acetyltransferase-like isoleucine patch superfamily enzyme